MQRPDDQAQKQFHESLMHALQCPMRLPVYLVSTSIQLTQAAMMPVMVCPCLKLKHNMQTVKK